jgi:hypothetical protein
MPMCRQSSYFCYEGPCRWIDYMDHTLFRLPAEKTIICGDAVYRRSTHVYYVFFISFIYVLDIMYTHARLIH